MQRSPSLFGEILYRCTLERGSLALFFSPLIIPLPIHNRLLYPISLSLSSLSLTLSFFLIISLSLSLFLSPSPYFFLSYPCLFLCGLDWRPISFNKKILKCGSLSLYLSIYLPIYLSIYLYFYLFVAGLAFSFTLPLHPSRPITS